MKILPLLAICCFATAASAADPSKLAYEQKDAVWVANIDGTHAKKIAPGQSPDLSPDGAKLAFNTVQATGQPSHRQIAVADLATGKITILKDIPSENCMDADWSPDGKQILFDFYTKDNAERRTGIVNADGSGFRDAQKSEPKYKSYWAATWAADGQSIFADDMEYLYQLDLNAKVLKKWKIEEIVPKGGMSGDSRLHASADGKTLLMDMAMDAKARKGWDDAPAAIWTLDLATGKTTRLTPKTLYAWDCHWLAPDAILFVSENPGEETPCIYRMSLAGQGKDRKLLVKNATLPGAAP
jgi:TolB protein